MTVGDQDAIGGKETIRDKCVIANESPGKRFEYLRGNVNNPRIADKNSGVDYVSWFGSEFTYQTTYYRGLTPCRQAAQMSRELDQEERQKANLYK